LAVPGTPNPTIDNPVAGTITLTRGDEKPRTSTTTARRGYSIELPAGTYGVTGRTASRHGSSECSAVKPVAVRRGQTAHADVYCQID
jgi:hypothetical protein